MPYYDLHCPVCDKDYNISASIADKTEKRIACPDCGSHDLETIYNGAPAYVKSKGDGGCPNRHICGSGCSHAG